MRLGAILFVLSLGLPARAMDLPDALTSSAPEGAVQTAFADQDFNSYSIPVGPFGGTSSAVEVVEGRVIWSAFRLDDETTTADLMAGYRNWLLQEGFTSVFECQTTACGGFDFRFEASILPAPGMLMDVADFRQLTMQRPSDDSHASILVSRVLNVMYIQTVMVMPNDADRTVIATPNVETSFDTVILPTDEKALYDRLISEGHIRIEGLEFETGGDAISPGSETALDLLARLLNRNDIAVMIVGHSDNVGDLGANRELSKRRAEAVKTALVARGVVEQQLTAEGIGFLAPLESNATPEGRAINRRVELVLR